MSKKSNLYTGRGDDGTTSLVSGTRVHKSDMRIDIYGDLDQLNSLIGFSLVVLKGEFDDINQTLTQIQKDLFVMGSNMACEEAKRVEYKLPQLTSESITDIEKAIDKLDGALPILKSFILPSEVREVQDYIFVEHSPETWKENLPTLIKILNNHQITI